MSQDSYYSTLSIIVFFFSALSCLVAFATWLGFRRKIRGTKSVFIGFIFFNVGIILAVICRPYIDGRIIQAGGNILEASGSIMLFIGISKILDRQLTRAWNISLWIIVLIANLFSLIMYLLESWLWLSNLVEGLSNAIPALAITVLLLNRKKTIEYTSRIIAGSVFAFIAFFFMTTTVFVTLECLNLNFGPIQKAFLDIPNPIIWGCCLTCLSLISSNIVFPV